MSMSSHVVWRQRYDTAADIALTQALATLQCEVRELPSQQWDARTSSIGGVRDSQCSYLSPAAPEWSSVLLHLNALIGERLAAELSRLTSAPSIVLSEDDQTTWGYALFLDGAESDSFWSVPEIVGVDGDAVRGTPSLVSQVFGVPESTVAPYLQHLSAEPPDTPKVFPDDEFALSDHWVRVDFMRRLGLQYPAPGETAGGRHIQIVDPDAPRQPDPVKPLPSKPRWKFW
jgi:hypothetical protein